MSTPALNPGLLRQRILIQQRRAAAPDTFGPVDQWVTIYTVYASITALQGREMERVNQVWADARFRVLTQFIPDIEAAMRISWWDGTKTRTLNIEDVADPDGTRAQLRFYCAEVI